MSGLNGRPATLSSRPILRAAPHLSVLVACHTFVCAISTRHVTRLALDGDLEDASDLGRGFYRCDGVVFASFNLGSMLGLAPLGAAWVLLRIPRPRGHVAVALRTGTCLVVRHVEIEAPLPEGLFSSRGAAVRGAFAAGAHIGVDESLPYGLVLDIERLWTEAELHSAETALNLGRGRVQRG